MPQNWYIQNIKVPVSNTERYKVKIDIIVRERENFIRLFRSDDADRILLMIDSFKAQIEAGKPSLLNQPFIYLLRQTINTLQIKSIDWILGTVCNEVPFGALQRFNDNAGDFFLDFEEQYYEHADSNPTLISRVNDELVLRVKEFEEWKAINPEESKKEPFTYIHNIMKRTTILFKPLQTKEAPKQELPYNNHSINYLEIVLNSYSDFNLKNNLPKYFFREFKKAEKEYYDAGEFFGGCLNVIQDFENNLLRQLHKRKFELYQVIDICKRDKEPFNEVVEELNSISLDNFSIHLASITNNKYSGHFWNSDVIKIKNEINEAYKKIIPPPLINIEVKPAILPSTLTSLFPIENVYFVHYQCDNFENSECPQITDLCVFDNIEVMIFSEDEVKSIENYYHKVDELNRRGLMAIHWNQNRPNYGIAHIKKRYKTLTGKDIPLVYSGSLNLADYLQFKYGEDYVPHKRLNSLAKINGFSGDFITESDNNTYTSDRILLLSKIYLREFQGNLKITNSPNPQSVQKNIAENEINHQNVNKAENNSEDISKTMLNNIFPTIQQSSLNPDQRKVGLILFQFNAYFTLESITMTIPSKNIPKEIYRKEVDDFSDFDLIFKREFNKIKESGHPILPILFCNLEIKKFKKWISDYEKIMEENQNEDFTPVYPDGYRRALNYLEYLSELIKSGQFNFLNNQPDNSNDEDLPLPPSENKIDEESLARIIEAIADHLEGFKNEIPSASDFEKVCLELQHFFEGNTINITKPIFIKNGNITKLAYELGSLYKELKNEAISIEYLQLLIRLFTIYQKEKIDGKPITSTNLYKYLTTKS